MSVNPGTKGAAMRKHIRKIVSTAMIAALIFFTPSFIAPWVMPANAICVSGSFSIDTAFAFPPCQPPTPPTGHASTPAWPWVVIGCAGSIVLSALVADLRDNRELTSPEAWTCGLLYWIPKPYPPQPTTIHHH